MRISVSLRSGYPLGDVRTAASWMVERAAAARDAGLDGLFVGDHHARGEALFFQNTPVLGRLLAEWGDAPSGALFLLPLWHPLLVAEHVGTLAALARGRFILQCAIGEGADQFGSLGVDLRTRPSRMEAALDIVRRLLSGEEVTTFTPYEIRGARIGLLPPEPVQVWVGGHVPAALDRAARLGDAWLAGPAQSPDEAARRLAQYRERCRAHGRLPSVAAIRRDIHVGADPIDAERVAEPFLTRGSRGLNPAACIVGAPEQVAEAISNLGKTGFTDVVVRHFVEDQESVLASFARLAKVRELLSTDH